MTTKDAQRSPAAFKVRPNALLTAQDDVMYAEFLASVPEVDRENEIIFPEDYNVAEWKLNPVWLWAHDKSELPVGAGYRNDEEVACDQTKEALILGCRFSQVNPKGALLYGLYKEKTIKMVSVGFISSESEQMPGTAYGVNGPITRILNPELVECSCVPIGMNRRAMLLGIKSWDGYVDREALAAVLDKGHLHGEKVPQELARDLAPFAARKSLRQSHWAVKGIGRGNKIPNLSSQAFSRPLRLNQLPGSPFMAAAKAPLSAGVVPGKVETKEAEVETGVPPVETKTVEAIGTKAVDVKAEAVPVVETKSETDTPPGSEMVMSVGGQIFKAAMDHMAEMCKGVMEMVPQSDSEELRGYMTQRMAKYAGMIGEDYEAALKMFPDYADQFEQSATLAAEYAALAEEPDAAMNNTDAEAEMQDEEKADDEPTEQDGEEKPEDAEGEEGKAVTDEVVTVKQFNEWHAKTFGETNAKEYLDGLFRGLEEKLETLAAQVAEHQEDLSNIAAIEAAR